MLLIYIAYLMSVVSYKRLKKFYCISKRGFLLPLPLSCVPDILSCEWLIHFILVLTKGGLTFSSSEIGTSLLCSAVPMIVLVFVMARVSTNAFLISIEC